MKSCRLLNVLVLAPVALAASCATTGGPENPCTAGSESGEKLSFGVVASVESAKRSRGAGFSILSGLGLIGGVISVAGGAEAESKLSGYRVIEVTVQLDDGSNLKVDAEKSESFKQGDRVCVLQGVTARIAHSPQSATIPAPPTN
jgi:outer membrane lipoprotein SlyB